jgi:hypothetical protein
MTEIQPHYSSAVVSEDNQILSAFLILYDWFLVYLMSNFNYNVQHLDFRMTPEWWTEKYNNKCLWSVLRYYLRIWLEGQIESRKLAVNIVNSWAVI